MLPDHRGLGLEDDQVRPLPFQQAKIFFPVDPLGRAIVPEHPVAVVAEHRGGGRRYDGVDEGRLGEVLELPVLPQGRKSLGGIQGRV